MKTFEITGYYGIGGLIGSKDSFIVEAKTKKEAVELLNSFPDYYAVNRSFELDFYNIESVVELD